MTELIITIASLAFGFWLGKMTNENYYDNDRAERQSYRKKRRGN